MNSDRTTLFELEVLEIINSTLSRYHARQKIKKENKKEVKNDPCVNITNFEEYSDFWNKRYASWEKE